MLNIQKNDVVYDVGCGKGSFLIEAAKQVERCERFVGIEYDEALWKCCKENVEKCHLEDRVRVVKADATKYDFSDATAMFLYLVPNGLRAIYSDLEKRLLGGCKIVSYTFSIPNLKPVKEISTTKAGLKLRLYDRSCIVVEKKS
jgi:precorrin-6B methylase 2